MVSSTGNNIATTKLYPHHRLGPFTTFYLLTLLQ